MWSVSYQTIFVNLWRNKETQFLSFVQFTNRVTDFWTTQPLSRPFLVSLSFVCCSTKLIIHFQCLILIDLHSSNMSIRQCGGRQHVLTKFVLIPTEVPSKIRQWQNVTEFNFSWWLITLNADFHVVTLLWIVSFVY